MASIQNQSQPQGQPGQTPGQSPRQLGTGFTNLQTIMGANTGNKLGQAVAGGIENAGQQTTNALQEGQQNFQQQSQQNAVGTQADQQNVQNVLTNLGVGANGQPSSSPNPTSPSSTDIANFQKYESGQYNGPTNISNISDIQNKAQNAQQQGQEVSTAGGRQALLQQYAARPGASYGSGAQNLDSVILGTTGGQQLGQARQAVSGLTNQVNSAQTAAQQQAQQLTNQAQGFGQQVTGQVSGAANNIYGTAQQTAQQANATEAANQTAEQAAQQAASQGNVSQAALDAWGLGNGGRTYGVNLGQFIGYNPANEQATALNVMGQPQYQQYSGLQQLMGQTPTAQTGPAFKGGNITYDTGAMGAIDAAAAPLAPYASAISNVQGKIAALQGNNSIGGIINRQGYQDQLAQLQQQYNNLNAQLGGTVNVVPS